MHNINEKIGKPQTGIKLRLKLTLKKSVIHTRSASYEPNN